MNRSVLVLGYSRVGKSTYISSAKKVCSTIFVGDEAMNVEYYEGNAGAGELATKGIKPAGVVILFDWTNTKTFEIGISGIDEWYAYVKKHFGNVNVVLCGSKVDAYEYTSVEMTKIGKTMNRTDSVSTSIGKYYAKGGLFFDVSSKNMTNVSASVYSLFK